MATPDHSLNSCGSSDPVVAMLTAQMATMVQRFDDLVARVETRPTPPAEALPVPAIPELTPTPPTLTIVPPASRSAGTSSSLQTMFPTIEAAHITAIITHSFNMNDLYKLDSKYRNNELVYTFNTTTLQFEASDSTAHNYKTPDSLLNPLLTYFNILSFHNDNRMLPFVFFKFITHFNKISRDYEWPAVLEYLTVFFQRRRFEMLDNGDYSKWAHIEEGLMIDCLFWHKKPTVPTTSGTSKTAGSKKGNYRK